MARSNQQSIDPRGFQTHFDRTNQFVQELFGFQLRPNQRSTSESLLGRNIAELPTGEGKTLAAAPAVSYLAQQRNHVFVCTANDYLARRDQALLEPLYQRLSLSTGAIVGGGSLKEKQEAYRCDIVYGTVREFGFDYLRDCINRRADSSQRSIQPEVEALVVDEADSVLIDEARTPLVISSPVGEPSTTAQACYQWCARVAPEFREGEHYVRTAGAGATAFTKAGRNHVYRLSMPPEMNVMPITEILHSLERAIYVNHMYHRDRHYLIENSQVVIIDEYTGRVSEGRTWSEGIHQAIEAREGVPITGETYPKAQITVQDYTNRFDLVSGMTGTAIESRSELQSVYGLDVHEIPTHRSLRREVLPERVFGSIDEKCQAIVIETLDVVKRGRAVLIGTRTVEQTHQLAEHLISKGLSPQVLNATNPDQEAEIIAHAGQTDRVTVATNMAGRGTDIVLSDDVRQSGGLHVICAELHGAARIDRQLAGRCARCGDPGTFRQYMSWDDDILQQAYGPDRAATIGNRNRNSPTSRILRKAQKRVQLAHQRERKALATKSAHMDTLYRSLGLDPVLDRLMTPSRK